AQRAAAPVRPDRGAEGGRAPPAAGPTAVAGLAPRRARGPGARVGHAQARRGRAGPGPAQQPRAGRGRAGPGAAHQARAGRGRAGPGPAHHGPADRSPARAAPARTDGRGRDPRPAPGPVRPVGRRGPRDLGPEPARARTDGATRRTAALARTATVATPLGEMARARTALGEPAPGPVQDVIIPDHAPAARRMRHPSGAPGALVGPGVRPAVARTGARSLVALARRAGRRPPALIGDGQAQAGPRHRASVARRPAVS